jgi:hypothetical protein
MILHFCSFSRMMTVSIALATLQILTKGWIIMPTQQEMSAWAEAQYLREKLAELEAQTSKRGPTSTPSSRHEGQTKQAEWQEAFEAHGRIVPGQREGEPAHLYNIRLASTMQEYSPEWKGVNLYEAPSFMVERVLGEIRADALKPTSHKADIPPGVIKEIVKRDESGRNRHEFVSSDNRTTFISQMNNSLPRRVTATVGNQFVRLLDYMNGVIGTTPRNLSVKPQNASRGPLYRGLPR